LPKIGGDIYKAIIFYALFFGLFFNLYKLGGLEKSLQSIGAL
jgi:hypothetical protein